MIQDLEELAAEEEILAEGYALPRNEKEDLVVLRNQFHKAGIILVNKLETSIDSNLLDFAHTRSFLVSTVQKSLKDAELPKEVSEPMTATRSFVEMSTNSILLV